MAAAKPVPDETLPMLRQDLKILRPTGEPETSERWLIYDPVCHRYIEIDQPTFEILTLWRPGATVSRLLAAVAETFDRNIGKDDVAAFIEFAAKSNLLDSAEAGDWRRLSGEAARQRLMWRQRLLHNYLFFKIPVFRPQNFLVATRPYVEFLFSRSAAATIVTIGILGLYLASRQWDAFLATFHSFLDLDGALAFAVALIAVKSLHELGHAYTAVRLGCHVPTMGVAFMMLTPMLYTDVTDAWRLGRRRDRLAIDAAGVAVELMLASVATFAWTFLPEGNVKGVAFIVATTGWLMSLAINLNPFMRFDGYFLLADLTGVANLQPRSFALARWHLREVLFGLGEPPPEAFPRHVRGWLIAYAWCTWIYRLLLFLAIAVLVYMFFFKALGIFLFVAELVLLLAVPIWREIMEWKKRWPAIRGRRRAWVTATGLTAILAAALVPWSRDVEVPVVIEPSVLQKVFPPRAAEILEVRVEPGTRVAEGAVLAVLKSDQLEHELRLLATRVRATEVRLARVAADASDREQSDVLRRELTTLRTQQRGLEKVREDLIIKAPISGKVVEVAENLHSGRVVGRTESIATIVQFERLQARGYVAEKDVWRIAVGARGRFIPDDGARTSLPLFVSDIAEGGVARLEIDDLSSLHGGPIATSEDFERKAVPVSAQYSVVLTVEGPAAPPELRIRGLAVVGGVPQSFADRLWRRAVSVLIRESGF